MSFFIGNVKVTNSVVLAPMAGISNPSYMKICEEMGVGYAITELISAEAIVRNNKKTFEMLSGIETLKIPVGIQLFGSNSETLAASAKIVTDLYKNVFIDINMGCPVPKVALKNQAGSALLKDLQKIAAIVQAVSSAVKVPVTVKIRSGWDQNHLNAVEVAKVCEKSGAKAIAIHARTRAQGYSGKADWNIIKQVKENVSIPVIGNGDVSSVTDFWQMLEYTGCDAVMIGRGCIGNPWLIKECVKSSLQEEYFAPTMEEKIAMIKKHFNLLTADKNEHLAILEMRTHLMSYLKHFPRSKSLKLQIFKCQTKEELFNLLDEYLKK